MSSLLKYLLFVLVLGALLLPEWYWPTLERSTGWSAMELGGAERGYDPPTFTLEKWLTGSYQRQFDGRVRQSSALRPMAVRSRNQMEYDIFGDLGNRNHYMGKDQFIFDHGYTNAYLGRDFVGAEKVAEKMEQLKVVEQYCVQQGVPLLIATPPGKPHIFPQRLPQTISALERGPSNRATYVAAFQKAQIPYIDFSHFKAIQDTSSILVYPQAGLHWSYYGVGLAMDTIRNYMAQQFALPVGTIEWKNQITFSKDFKDTDLEMMRGINLLHPFELAALPYPTFTYQPLPDQERPRILVIGDSYFNILWEEGFVKGLFHPQSSFWYYFNQDYSDQKVNVKALKNQPKKLLDTLDQYDVILLSMSESNLASLGFHFIESCFAGIQKRK